MVTHSAHCILCKRVSSFGYEATFWGKFETLSSECRQISVYSCDYLGDSEIYLSNLL